MKRIIALFMCLTLSSACLTGCTSNEVFIEKSYIAMLKKYRKSSLMFTIVKLK